MADYTSLITSEHADKPRFLAAVAAATQPFADMIVLLGSMAEAFDVDVAQGLQLDAVGLWVGVSRQVPVPLTGVYFEFDNPLLGWDVGFWKGPFDPTEGLTTLDDDHYRPLIKAKIAANHWDGTIPGAQQPLLTLLPTNPVFMQDNQDMSITVAVVGPTLDVVLQGLLTGGHLALKPEGVRIDYMFSSVPPSPIFGFDVESDLISGWGGGSWGVATQQVIDPTVLTTIAGEPITTVTGELITVSG